MDLGWISDTVNVHDDAWWKTLETNDGCPSLGQRLQQVSQQYDQSEQQDRERANLNGNHSFANKILLQPLEPGTDAQSNLHLEFYKRNVPGGMRTPWDTSCQCDDEEFQEMIKVAQKTVVTHKCQDRYRIQTMTHSKVQNMVDARPRADSSAVARCNVVDLEQTNLRKEQGSMKTPPDPADGAPQQNSKRGDARVLDRERERESHEGSSVRK